MTPRAKKGQPLSTTSEWSFELIRTYDREIARLAERYALDTYPNQIEVITAEQMMDAYASVGMPIGYHHWSYGKHFLSTEKGYKRGQMGLAYEIVINSDPCIAYLMEENTMCMQALVVAHACYGHNSFFKGNYLFRSWTDASSIVDYLVFARQYIDKCEERYGIDAVEDLLDSCHALMNYGVDRYKRPYPISAEEERRRQKDREEQLQRQVNDLWRTIPKGAGKERADDGKRFPAEPQENILYFIEKHAPLLEPWQREVVRIVRKIAQYFYPQRQTQVMNEGWATFWHYTLLNDLYDEGLVTEGFMMEFLQYHTSVVYQPPFDSPYYSGINPYALGFAMYRDIRRICEEPTDEDRRWFPDIAGSDWLATLKFAMQNFKDESFIQQFLSPRLIREFRLFSILDDDQQDELLVDAIHDDSGYRTIRDHLAAQYNLGNREPNVQIWNVDRRGDRSLTLRHYQHERKPLGSSTEDVLRHLHRLWGFDVHLDSMQGEQRVAAQHMPPRRERESEGSHFELIVRPV
ncbi:SpoVR family protein [Pseudomonas sp. GCM10022188]|uniref:SpoVR family protein n=1 Tax=Pseudomonas TaxID=286 RepID=UPI001E2D614C|nr:SpoVR family protein [Pseudomonas oryzagri]MCC6075031.1 SpoVR family protein [Pseudomonas oryzagri]